MLPAEPHTLTALGRQCAALVWQLTRSVFITSHGRATGSVSGTMPVPEYSTLYRSLAVPKSDVKQA